MSERRNTALVNDPLRLRAVGLGTHVRTTVGPVSVYNNSNTNSVIVGNQPAGALGIVVQQADGWWQVNFDNGVNGWVASGTIVPIYN